MHPSEQTLRSLIREVLEGSDIVWPKYGLDTYDNLTQKIIDRIREGEFKILDWGDYHELAGTYD